MFALKAFPTFADYSWSAKAGVTQIKLNPRQSSPRVG
jgi:hypothetical protein